jgi:hypothetical protein
MLIVNYQWYHNEKMIHYAMKYQLNSIQKIFLIFRLFLNLFILPEYTKHIDLIMIDMMNMFLLNYIVL